MESIFVYTITTARRMHLLKKVLHSAKNNRGNLSVKFVICKNGTYSDKEFFDYDFELENLTKVTSSPGGHLSKALNRCTEEFGCEDYMLFIEDDFLIHTENWLQKMVEQFNEIENCGSLGVRKHGYQRYNDIPGFDKLNSDVFEVFWSDGIVLFDGAVWMDEELEWDEDLVGAGEVADLCNQISDLGFENWRMELDYSHYHISGDRTGTNKWKYAEIDIDMPKANRILANKWKNSKNKKIQKWLEYDSD